MRIIDTTASEIRSLEIPVNTVFTGIIGDHKGVFLRHAFGVVMLVESCDPQRSWSADPLLRESWPDVKEYRPREAELHLK